MNANKIELNGEVLLDLTQDTVTEADVTKGKTFHKADGTLATGTNGGGEPNIAYGDTAPEDTNKLWLKCDRANKITMVSSVNIDKVISAGITISQGGSSTLYPAVATFGDIVYFFGGKTNSSDTTSPIIRIDPVNKTQTILPEVIPVEMNHMGCAVVEKKVYLLGGFGDSTYYDTIYVFDSETELLSKLDATLPKPLAYMACGVYGKTIYLAGGSGSGSTSITPEVYAFDTENETLSLVTKLPYKVYQMGYATIGTKLYMFHGKSAQNVSSGSYRDYITWFDMENGTHEVVSGDGSGGRAGITAFEYNSKIYTIGGIASSSKSADVSVFDPISSTWSAVSSMSQARSFMSASAAIGNKVYLFGGQYYTSTSSSSSALVNREVKAFVITEPLAEKEMIAVSSSSNTFELFDNFSTGFGKIYIGNKNNMAEPVSAALYKDGEWVTI